MTETTPRREQTRLRLVEAAIDEFALRGIDATSVEQLCEAAGFSRGAFYSNFTTKDDLCIAIMEFHRDQVLAGLSQVFDNLPQGVELDWVTGEALREFFRIVAPTEHFQRTLMEIRLRSARSPELGGRVEQVSEETRPGMHRFIDDLADQLGLEFRISTAQLLDVLESLFFYDMSSTRTDVRDLIGPVALALSQPKETPMAEIQQLVTAGNHDPDGPPVHENNVWLVGDDTDVLVIDPAHDADAVAQAVNGRRVIAVVLTHGHWDHVRAARDFAALVGDPEIFLSPEDQFLWAESHCDAPFSPLLEDKRFKVGGTSLDVVGTPGHTPGSMSLYCSDLNAVFTGDTLFEGGPGATRWDYSSFERIIASIQSQLFTLPDDTVVHTGHGPSTSIGAESANLQEWVARGW